MHCDDQYAATKTGGCHSQVARTPPPPSQAPAGSSPCCNAIGGRTANIGSRVADTPCFSEDEAGHSDADTRSSDSMGPSSAGWANVIAEMPSDPTAGVAGRQQQACSDPAGLLAGGQQAQLQGLPGESSSEVPLACQPACQPEPVSAGVPRCLPEDDAAERAAAGPCPANRQAVDVAACDFSTPHSLGEAAGHQEDQNCRTGCHGLMPQHTSMADAETLSQELERAGLLTPPSKRQQSRLASRSEGVPASLSAAEVASLPAAGNPVASLLQWGNQVHAACASADGRYAAPIPEAHSAFTIHQNHSFCECCTSIPTFGESVSVSSSCSLVLLQVVSYLDWLAKCRGLEPAALGVTGSGISSTSHAAGFSGAC